MKTVRQLMDKAADYSEETAITGFIVIVFSPLFYVLYKLIFTY